jgi:hypothetical protein
MLDVLSEAMRLALLLELAGEPVKTLEETVTRGGASGLDVPSALPQAVKAELVCDLSDAHGVRKILLVGKDQEKSIPQLILVEHALKLFAGLWDTVTIVGVDDENDTLGVLEVMSPEGTNLVLATDIPHGELDVGILDGLDIETDGRDGGDDFTELELVQNGGLAGSVETDHQNSHLLLVENEEEADGIRQFRSCHTHLGGVGSLVVRDLGKVDY